MPPPTDAVAIRTTAPLAALASLYSTPPLRITQTIVLASVVPINTKFVNSAQIVVLAAVRPVNSPFERSTQQSALVSYNVGDKALPRTTQLCALVSVKSGISGTLQTRVWTFDLDGHTFYVVALGKEGTFLYDIDTQQWCKFETDGYGTWNMDNGIMWNGRVVAADLVEPIVWELDPDTVVDDGWRQVFHIATGKLEQRTRKGVPNDTFRLNCSVDVISEDGAIMRLRWSDDQGRTWSDYMEVPLSKAGGNVEVSYRSLGTIQAPGRIFEVSDYGGVIRIDDANADLNGIDSDAKG